MHLKLLCPIVALLLTATQVSAEFAKITDGGEFNRLVTGKTLTRPLVRLELTPQGNITGVGVRWEVVGNWSWREGFFCRDLNWGGSDLGYNCQEVRVQGSKIRFISDRGTGDFADFRMR